MASAVPRNEVLGQLQSKAQVELIDSVDRLRSMGCQGELDLPQLIVCGDTSSGKSSVLEAVSRIKFPAASTLCTRFATELILRKAAVSKFDVYLVADSKRPEDEQAHVLNFKPPGPPGREITENDFPSIVEAAVVHMNELGDQEFHEDRLVATVHGPNVPSLTLVDLPGLIRTSSEDTQSCNVDVVRKITDTYMGYQNSTILAVLAAGNNMMNQEVLEIAKLYDQGGVRTIGIITKPDKVDPGSDEEKYWIETAKNNKKHLALGWHVLKNRSFDLLHVGAAERDTLEARFFQDSNWSAVPLECRGVSSLRERLATVLDRSVRESLPKLVRDVNTRAARCEDNLAKLGRPNSTDTERQQDLTAISFSLSAVIKESVEGRYSGKFYHDPNPEVNALRKLRAQLQHAMQSFHDTMARRGGLITIVEDRSRQDLTYKSTIDFSTAASLSSADADPIGITEKDLFCSVRRYIDANQGCDLPGLGLSQPVTHLFKVQSCPWEAIAYDYVEHCWTTIRTFFVEALSHTAPPHICDAIIQYCDQSMEKVRSQAIEKVNELLKPYRRGYMITSKADDLRSIVAKELVQCDRAGKENSSAAEAWTYVQVYYLIASHTFTETVVTLVVENCLVESLSNLFTPMTVSALNTEKLRELTAEPAEVAIARSTNEENLGNLRAIQAIFRKHTDRNGAGMTAFNAAVKDHLYEPPKTTGAEDPYAALTPRASIKKADRGKQSTTRSSKNRGTESVPAPPVTVITPPKSPSPNPFDQDSIQRNWTFGQTSGSAGNLFAEYSQPTQQTPSGTLFSGTTLRKTNVGHSPTPRRKAWIKPPDNQIVGIESTDEEL